MKQVQYTDKDGRLVTKKEGFSWKTFWLLFIFTFVIGAIIYAVIKGGFIAARGTTRAAKRQVKKD